MHIYSIYPTPRISLFVRPSVRPLPKNIASYIANAHTMRGSHGLSAQRVRRTKSSRPDGPKASPKGRRLEVGARRAPRLLVYYIPCHPYAQALRCPLLCNALPPSHQLLQYDLISCRFMHCYYVLFTEPLPEGIPTTALFPIFTYTALTTIIACNMHVFAKIHLALADSVTY